jgi:hypothetical protein
LVVAKGIIMCTNVWALCCYTLSMTMKWWT